MLDVLDIARQKQNTRHRQPHFKAPRPKRKQTFGVCVDIFAVISYYWPYGIVLYK